MPPQGRLGRMLTHTNVVPQLRALLSPAAIFPRADGDPGRSGDPGSGGAGGAVDDRFFDRFFDDELGIPLALPPPPSPVGLDTSGELLCLDVGMRRTGVAVTQFVAGDVHALRVLHHPPRRAGGEQRMQALQDDIAYLERAIADHNVAGLVVGWPLEPRSGQPGVQCERVRSYVVRLQQAALLMSLSAGLLDERYGQQVPGGGGGGNDGDSAFTETSAQVPTPDAASALAGLDVYAWDERYTSKAVQSLAMERVAGPPSRRSKKKKKRRRKTQSHVAERQAALFDNSDDDLAAAYILSEVVDAMFADEEDQWRKDMGF